MIGLFLYCGFRIAVLTVTTPLFARPLIPVVAVISWQ
jgi:hypothetical protein